MALRRAVMRAHRTNGKHVKRREGRGPRWLAAVAVAAAGVVVPGTVAAPAEAAVPLTNVTGAVSDVRGVDGTDAQCINYNPAAGTASAGEVDVAYGRPSGESCPGSLDLSKQSGVGFDASAPGTVTPSQPFLLASIIHYNNPIQGLTYPAGTRSAFIGGTLTLRLGDFQGNPTVEYPWLLEETANSGTCPYGATDGVLCDDRLSFTDPSGSRSVVDTSGQHYRLTISSIAKAAGEQCPATPPASSTDAFVTKERAKTTGCVYGILDPVRQVTIEKRTRPQGAPDTFTFDQTGRTIDGTLPATSTLGDRETKTYEIAGDASFTERDSAGWALTDLACTGDTSGVRIDKAAARFEVGALGGDVHCVFTNAQGGAIVEKRDADGGALIGPATFRFENTGGSAPAIVVTDNAAPDVDPTLGRVEVRGLVPGAWTVTETKAPQGYEIDAPGPVAFTVSADDTTPVKVPAFTDSRKKSALAVIKHESRPDGTVTDKIVPGATFQLWRETNGQAGLQPAGDTAVGVPCTTAGTDPCTVGGLDFGTYYWQETQAPQGYQLPPNAVSDPIVIDASNAGGQAPVTVIGDPQKRSELTITKYDAITGKTLPGATFALYRESNGQNGLQTGGDTLVESCVTGADGTCTIDDLPFGDYWWLETAAPEGYEIPGYPMVGAIRIDAVNAGGPIIQSGLADPQTLSALTVEKKDAVTGAELDGAVFDLRKVAADGSETTYATCTTQGGRCTVGELEFGTYYWHERTPPVGYELPADRDSDPIEITPQNAGDDFAVTTMRDPQTTSALAVLKQDGETEETVDGATFALYSETNGTPGLQPGGDTQVGECTTSGGEPCMIEGLAHGTYYWLETAAPQGYELPVDAQSGPIVVTAQNAGTTFPVTVIGDPQKKSELSVLKHDADTGAVVAGATFELWRDADRSGTFDRAADVEVAECTTTGTDPCAVDPVGFGTYFWVETKAPQGYELPAHPVSEPVVVSAANAGSTFTPVPVADPQLRSALDLVKTDAADGRTLAGAVFQLYADTDGNGKHDDGEPMAGGPRTTDAQGTIRWSDLLHGAYVAVELAAPDGYLLPKDAEHPVEITTDNAGTTLTIDVENERKPEPPKPGEVGGIVDHGGDGGHVSGGGLPNTGAPTYALQLSLLAGVMLLLGAWLLVVNRRLREE